METDRTISSTYITPPSDLGLPNFQKSPLGFAISHNHNIIEDIVGLQSPRSEIQRSIRHPLLSILFNELEFIDSTPVYRNLIKQ